MGQLIKETQVHMNCPFDISYYANNDHDLENAKLAFKAAFAEIARVERELTEFKESPFNEINKQAGKAAVKVSAEIFKLIEKSIELSHKSKGAFDISFATLSHYLRQVRSGRAIYSDSKVKELKKLMNYKNIIFNSHNQSVFLPDPLMRISLGGIGKGYGVDRAFNVLKEFHLSHFFINGSGDIRVYSGQRAPRHWRVALQNPFDPLHKKVMGYLRISQGAVATSGVSKQRFARAGKEIDHIIDQKHEHTCELISCTVMDATTVNADSLATTVMSLGQEEGLKWMQQQGISGFLVNQNGDVIHSKRSLESLKRGML